MDDVNDDDDDNDAVVADVCNDGLAADFCDLDVFGLDRDLVATGCVSVSDSAEPTAVPLLLLFLVLDSGVPRASLAVSSTSDTVKSKGKTRAKPLPRRFVREIAG